MQTAGLRVLMLNSNMITYNGLVYLAKVLVSNYYHSSDTLTNTSIVLFILHCLVARFL